MRTPTDYEKFVQAAIEEIAADSTVVHRSKKFVGQRSGRAIAVDLSFEMVAAGGASVLIVVECKRYRNRVQVADVEEFHSKLDDIGAHKGIMVTTVGYQAGAVRTATARGIALATLTDQPQPGEIAYIVASATSVEPACYCSDKLVQGNLRPWGPLLGAVHDDGFRFESFSQLWTMLHLGLED